MSNYVKQEVPVNTDKSFVNLENKGEILRKKCYFIGIVPRTGMDPFKISMWFYTAIIVYVMFRAQ